MKLIYIIYKHVKCFNSDELYDSQWLITEINKEKYFKYCY